MASTVRIGGEVDADDVVVAWEALVQQDGGDTRSWWRVVVLTPNMEETSRFMEAIGLRHGISRTVAPATLALVQQRESITWTKDS